VAFAPSWATTVAEVLYGSEGRLDQAIVRGVQHTEGVQCLVGVVLQTAVRHHFTSLRCIQAKLGTQSSASLGVVLARIWNGKAGGDDALLQALESEESMRNAFFMTARPRGMVVENTRLDLQLACFVVRTENVHEDLEAILGPEHLPGLAREVGAGLGTSQGLKEGESLFFWRDEVLCTAHPDFHSSLE